MPNRKLTSNELSHANELLAEIRMRLEELAGGDHLLLFAYRRKVVKELGYDERGKPSERIKLKYLKWGLQDRRCAHCGEEMPLKYSELDRKNAADRYTEENTELVHAKCHHERQAAKGYTQCKFDTPGFARMRISGALTLPIIPMRWCASRVASVITAAMMRAAEAERPAIPLVCIKAEGPRGCEDYARIPEPWPPRSVLGRLAGADLTLATVL